MRLGVFGGTFDPPHLGHLAVARCARRELSLDRVVFIPAGEPWMKAGQPVSEAGRRLAMTRLAIAGDERFEASDMETRRPGPSYTVDTLRELRRRWGREAELYLFVGADALEQLPRWREPAAVLRLATLVCFPRPGYADVDVASLRSIAGDVEPRVVRLEGPLLDVSGEDIRRRIAEGRSVTGLLSPAVERYVLRHRLYAPRRPADT